MATGNTMNHTLPRVAIGCDKKVAYNEQILESNLGAHVLHYEALLNHGAPQKSILVQYHQHRGIAKFLFSPKIFEGM
jgi:hypothetical protein